MCVRDQLHPVNGKNQMKKVIGLVTVFVMSGAIVLAQQAPIPRLFTPLAGALQVPPQPEAAGAQAVRGTRSHRRGSLSVRPGDTKKARTWVNSMMGWRVGIPSNVFRNLSFSDAAATWLSTLWMFHTWRDSATQKVSAQIQKNLDYNLSADEVAAVKSRLADLRMRNGRLSRGQHSCRRSRTQVAAGIRERSGCGNGRHRRSSRVAPGAGSSWPDRPELTWPLKLTETRRLFWMPSDQGNPHLGVAKSISEAGWNKVSGPFEGLAPIKDRLMVMTVRDRSAVGKIARNVALGTGVADIQKVLLDIAKSEPPPVEDTMKCSNCGRPYTGNKAMTIILDVDRYPGMDPAQVPWAANAFGDLARDLEGFDVAARPAMGYRVQLDALSLPITPTDNIPADWQKKRSRNATPRKPIVTPKKAPQASGGGCGSYGRLLPRQCGACQSRHP